MRSFDPRRVGQLECAMWVAYYRRDWRRLLCAAVALVRNSFGMAWPATLYGAWLILRANQQWAPSENDPGAARRTMGRFYALVAARNGEAFDVQRAAWLDVDWWRAHRDAGHRLDREGEIVDALVALYAHVYAVEPETVRLAAQQRTLAMRHSDRWVAEGRQDGSPHLDDERAALVRSYAALLAAVHGAPAVRGRARRRRRRCSS